MTEALVLRNIDDDDHDGSDAVFNNQIRDWLVSTVAITVTNIFGLVQSKPVSNYVELLDVFSGLLHCILYTVYNRSTGNREIKKTRGSRAWYVFVSRCSHTKY
jgi:hypothetical protein